MHKFFKSNKLIKLSKDLTFRKFSTSKVYYSKEIFYGVEARQKMLEGVQDLAKAVSKF